QGFDYCYDKRLYDHLLHSDATRINKHLLLNVPHQDHLVRFLENHDEARASTAFGGDKQFAATVLLFNLPGAKLLHEGQIEGHRVKLPVQLGRRPVEQTSTPKRTAFYDQ